MVKWSTNSDVYIGIFCHNFNDKITNTRYDQIQATIQKTQEKGGSVENPEIPFDDELPGGGQFLLHGKWYALYRWKSTGWS